MRNGNGFLQKDETASYLVPPRRLEMIYDSILKRWYFNASNNNILECARVVGKFIVSKTVGHLMKVRLVYCTQVNLLCLIGMNCGKGPHIKAAQKARMKSTISLKRNEI